MAKKVVNQAAALRIGWDIAPRLVGQEEQRDLDKAMFERNRSGKWTASKFLIEGKDFILDDEMSRHIDGRIRDHYPYASNLIGFARWFVQQFPDHSEAAEIRENLKNPAMVAATIEDAAERAAFKRLAKGLSALTEAKCNDFLAVAAA